MQLVQTNLIIVEHFPRELLKKEGVSHWIHIYEGGDFKITLGGAQGLH
jgi:hypothetical protein